MLLNAEEETFCYSLHPSLKHKNHIKIFFCGKVQKVGQTNKLSERFFILATNGIFLGKRKNFMQTVISPLKQMTERL